MRVASKNINCVTKEDAKRILEQNGMHVTLEDADAVLKTLKLFANATVDILKTQLHGSSNED